MSAASRRRRRPAAAAWRRATEELEDFLEEYKKEKFTPAAFEKGQTVRAYLGIDGGSTSSKAVLIDENAEILAKVYQLSKGNPIEDTKELIEDLQNQVESAGATLEILGVGTTGYAKDILKDVLRGDAAIVETVAHCESALHFYDDVDVVCDVGGQDIKIIILKNGKVKDFKLNTQCSAGNGYFLQSTAVGFGYDVKQYADVAFKADSMPMFGYGCAVFMQSDIVDFQRQGWAPEEIMAGLANVLPKNIWLYVSQIPNLAKLGKRFVLQGGTQHNMAAVKSQVDFIQSRFKTKGAEADVIVHKHCGESGAIGAAIEARRLHLDGLETDWIGLDKVPTIGYRQKRDESTRCYFCKNKCLRTFIDVDLEMDQKVAEERHAAGDLIQISKRPAATEKDPEVTVGTKRLIIATCEKGEVEDIESMRKIKGGLDAAKKDFPNMAEISAKEVWKPVKPEIVADSIDDVGVGLPESVELPPQLAKHEQRVNGFLKRLNRSSKVADLVEKTADRFKGSQALKKAQADKLLRIERIERRKTLRIGIPRVLNQYSQNPFFSAYFEALGIPPKNLIYSDFTSEELYKEGAKRGAIDPCFPSKVAIAHMHNLIEVKHKRKPLDLIVYPQVDSLETWLTGLQATRACPTVVGSADTTKAAFTKEEDIFAKKGIAASIVPFVHHCRSPSSARRQMYTYFKPSVLGLSVEENLSSGRRVAYKAQYGFMEKHRADRAARCIESAGRETSGSAWSCSRARTTTTRACVTRFPDELQKLGYPVLHRAVAAASTTTSCGRCSRRTSTRATSPIPFDISRRVEELATARTPTRKVWAAKFTARVTRTWVALELSSFKCGHDAPIYTVIEEIVENSGTPYFSV